jgi:hypothetical protein
VNGLAAVRGRRSSFVGAVVCGCWVSFVGGGGPSRVVQVTHGVDVHGRVVAGCWIVVFVGTRLSFVGGGARSHVVHVGLLCGVIVAHGAIVT